MHTVDDTVRLVLKVYTGPEAGPVQIGFLVDHADLAAMQ